MCPSGAVITARVSGSVSIMFRIFGAYASINSSSGRNLSLFRVIFSLVNVTPP